MKRIEILASLVFAILILSIITPLSIQFVRNNILNSPDANSNFIFAQSYSEKGEIFVYNEYLKLDRYNMFHFRSGVTYEDKIVPISFLGLPLVYGTFLSFLGDYIAFINLIFSFIILIFLYKIYRLSNNNIGYFLIGVIFSIPLVYYFAHSFMNILATISFWVIAIYYFLMYIKQQNNLNIFLSALFFSYSVIFRYEFIIYSFLLVLFLIINNNTIFKDKRKITEGIVIALIVFVAVFSMILISNYLVYGSPIINGADIFHKTFFPDRIGVNSGLISKIINVAVPNNIDASIILFNIYKYLFYFNPLFFSTGFLGLLFIFKEKRSAFFVIGLLILIFYLIAFQGSANVWGSSNTWGSIREISSELDHSMIRYWIPLYLFFPVVFGTLMKKKKMNNRVVMLLIFMIMITSLLNLVSIEKVNAFNLANKNNQKYNEYAIVFENLNRSSIVFSSLSDKYIYTFATPFTWWNGKEKYDPYKISDSLVILYKRGAKELYLYRENEVNIKDIEILLKKENLTLLQKPSTRLYKVTERNETSK